MRLYNGKVFFEGEFVSVDVCIEDGHILSVGGNGGGKEEMDLQGGYLIPGLIDVHTHGYGGVDVMEGESAALFMSKAYAKRGVTSFLPTTMSTAMDVIQSAVRGIHNAMGKEEGANIAGVHLEGPMLNVAKKGAQEEQYILGTSPETLLELCAGHPEIIRLLTLAPELPGAEATVRCARSHGITVSAGHSIASFECMQQAVTWGVSHVTHLFNAMNSLHHREPGIPTAGLVLDSLHPEIIADGIHLHPSILAMVARFAGDRACLVTDSLMAAGLPDGEYSLGGQAVHVVNGAAKLPGTDTLAGSTLTMDKAIQNMVDLAGVSLGQAVIMGSQNPAKSLGLTDRGQIKPGLRADLCLLGADMHPRATWVGGKLVYRED